MSVVASASPSLALVKYWGKEPGGVNVPSTTSIAIGLDTLRTTTRLSFSSAKADSVSIGGVPQPVKPFAPLLDHFREISARKQAVAVESENSFPTAAGIASSSSGFAALVMGLDALFETRLSRSDLSAIARTGSGSAARAVYGGFTQWRAGATRATELLPASHWPELRVVVAVVSEGAKGTSSREGMNHTRDTSPLYSRWVELAPEIASRAEEAVRARALEALGRAMRESYLLMFSTMFSARPPVFYWRPESVALIRLAEELRTSGVPVWETMDAGPQVKLLTVSEHVDRVVAGVQSELPGLRVLTSEIGGEPSVRADG